jgi:DHA1 family tetracycline resistance protein-like MFS transporter
MPALPTSKARTDQSGAVATLVSVIFINMLGFGVIVPLLPFYAHSFGAPAWQMALVFSAYPIGSFFGEPFWGRLSDRIGRKPLLVSTTAGNCLCYLALAFAPNIYVAFGIRLLGGLASGNGAVIQGYISDVTTPNERVGKMAFMGAAWNLGLIVGPWVGGHFARPDLGPAGFRIPLFISSGLAGLCALGILFLVKESQNRDRAPPIKTSRWAVMGEAARNPIISRMILLSFLAGVAFTGVEANFGLWAQDRFTWGPKEIGWCFAVTGAVSAFIQWFITGRLSRRFGEGKMLAVGMALTVVVMLSQPASISGTMTVVLMTLSAIGTSVAFPNSGALISRAADPRHQGQIMGLNNAAGALSRVVGPLIAGIAFSSVSKNAPFFIAAAAVLPAIWLALKAGQEARKLPEQPDYVPLSGGH